MSNDPLLGLDSQELVEAEQPEKSKWAEVPKKRSGGFAVRTRPGIFGEEEEWRPGIWVGPAPVLGGTRQEAKVTNFAVPAPEKQEELPRAYAVKKPSLFQRFLDWLLL